MQLVYHRDHNQHRLARWWRYFRQLKRYTLKLVDLFDEIKKVPQKTLQTHKDILEICAFLLRRKVFTKVYYELNSTLALGQFIALGFALLAMVSRVRYIVVQIDGVREIETGKVLDFAVQHDVDEIGEVVEKTHWKKAERAKEKHTVVEEPKGTDSNDRKRRGLAKTKKKKKAKSAMDDIFGF